MPTASIDYTGAAVNLKTEKKKNCDGTVWYSNLFMSFTV